MNHPGYKRNNQEHRTNAIVTRYCLQDWKWTDMLQHILQVASTCLKAAPFPLICRRLCELVQWGRVTVGSEPAGAKTSRRLPPLSQNIPHCCFLCFFPCNLENKWGQGLILCTSAYNQPLKCLKHDEKRKRSFTKVYLYYQVLIYTTRNQKFLQILRLKT